MWEKGLIGELGKQSHFLILRLSPQPFSRLRCNYALHNLKGSSSFWLSGSRVGRYSQWSFLASTHPKKSFSVQP